MHYDCLVVDDELSIAQTTSEYFSLFGVTAAYVCSYQECLDFIGKNEVSMLLLDINLGDSSGFSLCKEIRAYANMPILFISARTSDDDILTALNIGGDDYIQKPYSLNILLAKAKAVLKRCRAASGCSSLEIASIQADLASRKVICAGAEVKLKEMEYKLLIYFMQNPGRVLSKDELLQNVWQNLYIGEGTLSVHVRHLREKLEKDPNNPELIKTIWGTGYLLENAP